MSTLSISVPTKFANVTSRDIELMKSHEIISYIRECGFTSQLGGRFLPRRAFTDGAFGYSPAQLVQSLRRQMRSETAHFPPRVRRRLRYYFQVRMVPQDLRQKMANYVGLTFLPGMGRAAFPKDTVFWDIDMLEALTMNTRLDCPDDEGRKFDNFDTRGHAIELNRKTGKVSVGGAYRTDDGQPASRTTLSRSFSLEPGRDERCLPRSRYDAYEASLAVHEDILLHAASEHVAHTMPTFPRLYLAFKDRDSIPDAEAAGCSSALKRKAYDSIVWWLRHGCPPRNCGSEPWPDDIIQKLRGLDKESFYGWEVVENLLGNSGSSFLLEWNYNRCEREHEDLYLMPLALYDVAADPTPLTSAVKVFAEIKDFLGREVPLVNGGTDLYKGLSKVQVISCDGENALSGQAGRIDFDFGSAEIGREAEMAA